MTSMLAEPAELSPVLIALLKGVVYRDTAEALWPQLLALRLQVSDYVAVLGLTLVVDEAEGYAFLRSRNDLDQSDMPRLVARRSLSFHVSLLLALLRKKLAEFDAVSAETRLMLSRDQIVEMLRVFLPDTTNETRLIANIDSYLAKIVDLGFLRRLRGTDDQFEVRRIIKAFVDGQWLGDFETRLRGYRDQLTEAEAS
jgi:Domain of unknown function (DUF4194)